MKRTPDGRDFIATQTRANKRMVPHHIHMGKRVQLYGRLVPILGFGYVMHNVLTGESGPVMRTGEGFGHMALAYGAQDVAKHYQTGGSTIGLLTGGMKTPQSILEIIK